MKKPLWSDETSNILARTIGASLMVVLVWAGLWLQSSFAAIQLPIFGTILALPLWVIAGLGLIAALMAQRKPKTT